MPETEIFILDEYQALPAFCCVYAFSIRFGLWLSFYPFSQDEYLHIAGHWLGDFGASAAQIAAARGEALLWALTRGSRSGRVAKQFAQDWAARNG